jgi:ATP-binding cassette subfamily C protein CydCD
LGTYFHSSKEGLSAVRTILDVIDRGPAGRATASDTVQHAIADTSLASNAIEFIDVTSIYGDRGEGIKAPLTFSLLPRTTTLVCGPSGAGKSTLLALLVPFFPCTGGTIRIGGVNLYDVDTVAWRRQIGWVAQRPSLFSGTVLDNMRLGAPDITDAEAASLLARLCPDGTISPSTYLTADGEGLSGGERTRIALARSLARSPALLLLDEPTAFLDPRAASAVLSVLYGLSATTTMVIATHEPEHFPWATQVIDLGSGAGDATYAGRLGAVTWAEVNA